MQCMKSDSQLAAPTITPEMMKKGEEIMRDHADGMLGPYTIRHILMEVYAAMRSAEPPQNA